jgi:PLP dependent protein
MAALVYRDCEWLSALGALGYARNAMSIAVRLADVRRRIDMACERTGRSSTEVTLLGVTKGCPAAAVTEAVAAGLEDFGENRVREAAAKIESLAATSVRLRWHLIGHLQTNKVKTALNLFAILHSVDSLRLAQELSARAAQPVPILLEVNVSQEASKFGFTVGELVKALQAIAALPRLDVRGLMTVAPMSQDLEAARHCFRRLRDLRDAAGLQELSMGMTNDFEVAIDEGATMVRVGRAIFGARPEP